ncbi:efflux RND transporter periplasmic adaptor subunit [Algoriphagus hitonicola]|uniref:Membrane fusion protein, Cu(I)/Ag(I) efflux system n=1 Tax=Algoriphagus hitonicola TaxID=435880 RepID=A0A1I2TTL3_9BACT|nr:efflux RND transporter periplasmic adaptor subunit [Algoriphagus hitonicola]SFG68285.1 membrane fusion protein, Cu(I)/Ag(I) efflux system [Algoriphagus hitonicola]
MKKILNNKFALVTLALVFGLVVGWLLKPGAEENHEGHEHEETDSNTTWTCSMHPQIKLGEPGDCPICGMDLIPASQASKNSSNPMVFEMTSEAVAMAQIQTSKVGGGNTGGELNLTGKIQGDEREIATLTSKFPGRVERLFITFTGEKVEKGQRIATLYSPELMSAQQELLEAAKSKSDFPQLYEAAKSKLRLWKLSDQQIDAIEKSEKVQEQFDILADQSGVVTQRNVSVGDYVSTGSVLFNVINLDKLWVLLDAYETDLSFLRIGDQINFSVAGIPGENFRAKITFIDPVIDPNTRSAKIRAEVNNTGQNLKPEMFVNATVNIKSKSGASALMVPRTAVLWSGKRSVVYVKTPGTNPPTFEMREVTLGDRMGENQEIKSGILAGEEIVTNGVFAIDAAAQLSGNYSMMNRPETKSIEVSEEFREQITAVAEAYFQVKNGLVKDDLNETKKSLGSFEERLSAVNMKLVKDQAHDRWMKILEGMNDAQQKMASADELEEARKHFSMLSFHILEMTETFGLNKEVVYKDYCPMAFGDEGAYWLSEEKNITNPYFGSSMLTCGEIRQTYLKGQPVMNLSENSSPPAAHNH